MADTRDITGLAEVVLTLRNLPKALSGKNGGPLRRALYAAAKMMRDHVREKVPRKTGLLHDSIAAFRDRNPQDSGASERYVIGTRGIKRAYADSRANRRRRRVGKKYRAPGAGYYIKFLEFGTKGGQRNGSGITARRIMTNVFEADKDAAVTVFAKALESEVAAAVKKAQQGTV